VIAGADTNGPWLVGGPGRCGKTHLVLALWKHGAPVGGFPLEGLFTIYSRRGLPFARPSATALMQEYVLRPRYTDADRAETERPTDYLTSSVAELAADLPRALRDPVAVIGWVLDRFAAENGRKTWAAFDLHPEFRYPRFRRQLPGLKLAVMVRDPREAIAAGLFWRGVPPSRSMRDARFKHSLLLYCLGTRTGRALARRWPQDVHVFDFNALVGGNANERGRLTQSLGIGAAALAQAYDFVPDFDFDPVKGFRAPGGQRVGLLDDTEISEIAALTGVGSIGAGKTRFAFTAFARMVLAIGSVAPEVARTLIDVVYYPRRTMVRRINNARQLVADLRRAMRRDLTVPERSR
jgi:hypothetical protein